MTHTITLDQPVKPGDSLALVIPVSSAIQAGSVMLFSIDGKAVKIVTDLHIPAGFHRIEIETYKGDLEIPAESAALVFPPGSVVPDGDWLKGIKWQSKDSINQLEPELIKALELAQQEIKQVVDNFKTTAERVSREIKDILDRHV
jgi:hypothetical protein